MRKLILSALFLASAFQNANAQLMIQWSINGQPAVASLEVPELLNQGDVFLINFANLPYEGVNTISAQAGVSFTFNSNERSSAKMLRMEVFNTLDPIAVFTGDYNFYSSGWISNDPWQIGVGILSAVGRPTVKPWQDNQGVVKLTMMEGSLSMVSMSLAVRTADSLYEFTAVPEPSSLSLLALGGVVVALGRRR
jgi:hypothetical protein